jgi:hypothetical protein
VGGGGEGLETDREGRGGGVERERGWKLAGRVGEEEYIERGGWKLAGRVGEEE